MEMLAAQAGEALRCIDGRIDHEWATWLLDTRAYALDELKQYKDAQEVVNDFFSHYVNQADSLLIARFYMWDLLFKYRQGQFEEALESYNRGLVYAPKLPEERYKRYLLNAGSVHLAQGKFREALNIYRDMHQSFTTIPSPSIPMAEVYGRTLLGGAEAQLDMVLYQGEASIDLDTVMVSLSHAESIFNLAGSRARYASAQSALALAYALDNNMRDARPALDIAFSQVQQYDLRKPHLEALYRRALISYRDKNYAAALADIKEALTLGERYAIAEFESRLRLLQGQTHEKASQLKEALAAYEEAFNVARDSSQGRDKSLIEIASASAFRVAENIPTRPESPFPFLAYLFGFLAFLIIVALLAYLVWMALHRSKTGEPALALAVTQPAPVAPAEPDAVQTKAEAATAAPQAQSVEAEPVAGVSIPSLEHFAGVAKDLGLDDHEMTLRRTRLIYLIRTRPRAVRAEIEDPITLERLDRLESGKGSNTDLGICIEAWETQHLGAVFTGKPGNAAISQLQLRFGQLGIAWPKNPAQWDRLFGL